MKTQTLLTFGMGLSLWLGATATSFAGFIVPPLPVSEDAPKLIDLVTKYGQTNPMIDPNPGQVVTTLAVQGCTHTSYPGFHANCGVADGVVLSGEEGDVIYNAIVTTIGIEPSSAMGGTFTTSVHIVCVTDALGVSDCSVNQDVVSN